MPGPTDTSTRLSRSHLSRSHLSRSHLSRSHISRSRLPISARRLVFAYLVLIIVVGAGRASAQDRAWDSPAQPYLTPAAPSDARGAAGAADLPSWARPSDALAPRAAPRSSSRTPGAGIAPKAGPGFPAEPVPFSGTGLALLAAAGAAYAARKLHDDSDSDAG